MTGAGNESASALAHKGSALGVSPAVSPTEGASPGVGVSPLAAKTLAKFLPNEIGQIIEREWLRLAEAWPGVRLLAHQVMEDHFHGVIATSSFMKKPLGAIIGSLKARVSSAVGASIWAEGYVDTILFDDEAVEKAVRYVRENPWRLLVKREHPELYKPGGRYFEACANGRLLMLAPAAWPYLPGQKPITRWSACALNRIAQLIAGPGAAAINYRGMPVADVDRLVAEAVKEVA